MSGHDKLATALMVIVIISYQRLGGYSLRPELTGPNKEDTHMESHLHISDVDKILSDPGVHSFTKDIIRKGRTRDCVDAYYDVLLAARALKAIMDNNLALSRREGSL